MEIPDETIEILRNMLSIQGQPGNWDYDSYMHGMYNGMTLIFDTLVGNEVSYRDAPAEWLCDKKGQV